MANRPTKLIFVAAIALDLAACGSASANVPSRVEFDWEDPKAMAVYQECSGAD